MYNQSIYMMLGAQFSSLGIVGFMIYRGCKKNEAFRQRQMPPADSTAQKAQDRLDGFDPLHPSPDAINRRDER